MSKGFQTCEVLVRLVLAFGMDHIKKLKVKGLTVLNFLSFRARNVEGYSKESGTFGGS